MAQGGVAAAMAEEDAPHLHEADTLLAGAGIAEAEVARILSHEGPERIRELIALGANFDRGPSGSLALSHEAAHSRRRIVRAGGDAIGAELVRSLVRAVSLQPSIRIVESTFTRDLLVEEGQVRGVITSHPSGSGIVYEADAVVLATGGLGHLFAKTTNPREATGDGLAMAARAGARLADLEFVQFHPTALAIGEDPMPLLTEALRGEGALLVNGHGERFMLDYSAGELEPRDVVARATWQQLMAREEVFLDARGSVGENFPARFPTVFGLCLQRGIDPRVSLIPVSPAAHYHMGGVDVDTNGRTSLAGLWACGEVASSGVHGANRLASNSLLEALVFGARIARDVRETLQSVPHKKNFDLDESALVAPSWRSAGTVEEIPCRKRLREVMFQHVGLVRDAAGLRGTLEELEHLERRVDPGDYELSNLLTVGRLVAAAALDRRESRGGHYRSDFPLADSAYQHRSYTIDSVRPIESLPSW